MQKLIVKIIIAIAGLCVLAFAPGVCDEAEENSYTFTNIADTTGPFSTFYYHAIPLGPPSINDSGMVAFWAKPDAGVEGIYTGRNLETDTVADMSGVLGSFLGQAMINNNGTVVFRRGLGSYGGYRGEGIYTGPDPATDTVADTTGPLTDNPEISHWSDPSINNNGTVVFRSGLDAGGQGIFTGPNPATDTVVNSSGLFSEFNGRPLINDNGTVVFCAALDAGGEGVFTVSGSVTDTIADTSAQFSEFIGSPSINESGMVALWAVLDAGGVGIYTVSDSVTNTIVETGDTFSSVGDPSINDNGTVVFWASLGFGEKGIYTGADLTDKVIATGDSLFGSTVTELAFYRGLNNNDQIAFFYKLVNGVEGIAVATPVLPELIMSGNVSLSEASGRMKITGRENEPAGDFSDKPTGASSFGEATSQPGLSGVVMAGLPGDPETDTSGNYSATLEYGWSGSVTPTKAGYSFSPMGRSYSYVTYDRLNEDYIASIVQHTLTIDAGSGGTTDPSPGSYPYDYGTKITIKAIPDSGHEFSEWRGTVTGTDNPITIIMDSNTFATAYFSDGEEKPPCPIASVVYNNPQHPHVRILRDFRDKHFMPNKPGRMLIDLYYKYSPLMTSIIAKHGVLKMAALVGLLPFVAFSYLMLNFGLILTVIALVSFSCFLYEMLKDLSLEKLKGLIA